MRNNPALPAVWFHFPCPPGVVFQPLGPPTATPHNDSDKEGIPTLLLSIGAYAGPAFPLDKRHASHDFDPRPLFRIT